MYERLLIYTLLLNRSPKWNIERAPQIFVNEPSPVSLKQIWLACL